MRSPKIRDREGAIQAYKDLLYQYRALQKRQFALSELFRTTKQQYTPSPQRSEFYKNFDTMSRLQKSMNQLRQRWNLVTVRYRPSRTESCGFWPRSLHILYEFNND